MRRLRCPVRTVESRLRRARERLRPSLVRRGCAGGLVLGDAAAADVPPALPPRIRDGRMAGTAAGTVPAAVARLARSTMRRLAGFILRRMIMTVLDDRGPDRDRRRSNAGGAGAMMAATRPRVPPTGRRRGPSAAAARSVPVDGGRFGQIRPSTRPKRMPCRLSRRPRARASGRDLTRWRPTRLPSPPDGRSGRVGPRGPGGPGRPALGDQTSPGRRLAGEPYGDEFARAAALLVRHHGDDPEAVRIGLRLDNLLTSIATRCSWASTRGQGPRGEGTGAAGAGSVPREEGPMPPAPGRSENAEGPGR